MAITLDIDNSTYTVNTNSSFVTINNFDNLVSAENNAMSQDSKVSLDTFVSKYENLNGIDILQIQRNPGEIPLTSNFELQESAPLDARIVAKTKANLYSAAWWLGKNSSNPVYLYKGLVVSVIDTGAVYTYIGPNIKIEKANSATNTYLSSNNWFKVSGGEVEQDISTKIYYYNKGNKLKTLAGYILSPNASVGGITLTDCYTMIGGHSVLKNASLFYTPYLIYPSNTNSNNVIHNFNGLYIPNEAYKNSFAQSSDILNSVILLNMNSGNIILQAIAAIDADTSQPNSAETVADKAVLNLNSSLAELCLENNIDINKQTATRAGIKISKDSSISNTINIDASSIKINDEDLYPWNYTTINTPSSSTDTLLSMSNLKKLPWRYYNNSEDDGLIKARQIQQTNKVDFFINETKLSSIEGLGTLDENNMIRVNTITGNLSKNSVTVNAISVIMYLLNDIHQKLYSLNNTTKEIIKQANLDINMNDDDDPSISVSTGGNVVPGTGGFLPGDITNDGNVNYDTDTSTGNTSSNTDDSNQDTSNGDTDTSTGNTSSNTSTNLGLNENLNISKDTGTDDTDDVSQKSNTDTENTLVNYDNTVDTTNKETTSTDNLNENADDVDVAVDGNN